MSIYLQQPNLSSYPLVHSTHTHTHTMRQRRLKRDSRSLSEARQLQGNNPLMPGSMKDMPSVDFLLLKALIVTALAGVALQFGLQWFTGVLFMPPPDLYKLSVTRPNELRQVFSGGDPWVVVCEESGEYW